MTQTTAHRPVAVRSTIALKLLMAVSGLIFVAYVLAHMYGNLKAFSGRVAFDEYAYHLRTLGEPILPHAGALTVLRAARRHRATAEATWATSATRSSTRITQRKPS